MKAKIKLRDLTDEQWDRYNLKNCFETRCKDCKLYYAYCGISINEKSWINHKDLYSDKFLDQEIEIEKTDILDKVEKEYLADVIKPIKNRVVSISKKVVNFSNKNNKIFYYILIKVKSETEIFDDEYINFPYFKTEMYKGMENCKEYTLEDLGL